MKVGDESSFKKLMGPTDRPLISKLIMNLLKRGRSHKFDGQHYWELNVKGISEKKFLEDVSHIEGLVLRQVYRVPEHTYHRFFIFEIE